MFSSENSGAVILFPGSHGRRPPRERILEAILVESGELGYEHVAVRHVIERAQTSRATFYKHFEDREDCFAQAYGDAVEWLYRRMIGAAKRQPSWREGLRAALARPLSQRQELMERFSQALDSGRSEIPSRQAPPPVTSDFIVGAIDTLLAAKLLDGDGERAPEMLPGMLHFVVMQYLGESAAWEEMAAAPLATWKARREAAAEMPHKR